MFCRLRRVSSTPQLYTSLSSWWGYVCKKQRVLRCTATLEETTASGMDSKQPQVTSDEPAVNISGKLSLLQQVFTLYIIYIYIIFIYIYTHASTYTTCTLPHQSTVPREQAGPIIRGMVRRPFTAAAQICCLFFLGLPRSLPFSRSHNAARSLQKVLSTRLRLDTRAVFFFLSFFLLFQQAESFVGKRTQYTHQTPTKLVVPPQFSRSDCQEPLCPPPPRNAFPCGVKTPTGKENNNNKKKTPL